MARVRSYDEPPDNQVAFEVRKEGSYNDRMSLVMSPLPMLSSDFRRLRRGVFLIMSFFATCLIGIPGTLALGQALPESEDGTILLPLETLDVDQATATVSVLQEPDSPLQTLLETCQTSLPDQVIIEGKDMSEEAKAFCRTVQRFMRRHSTPPAHTLESKGYVISVPLKSPYQGIHSLSWYTLNLDDAIAFVSLLQSGNLRAVKVYTTVPWSSTPTVPCSACPIKELVFSITGMKQYRNERLGEPPNR